MNPPDERIAVQVDDPNADTEWNDILRKHGIIPEKTPSPTPFIENAVIQARELAHQNRLEGKDLEELNELEDEEDEDFLNMYRRKRLAELSSVNARSVYNQVYPVQKADWSRDVTDASYKTHVLVLLTSSSETNVESRVAVQIWRELAQRIGDVKFCQIRGDLCIEGYPDKNTPTTLVYKDGDIKRQIVTLRELNGVRTKARDVERLLVDLGAVKADDSRLNRKSDEEDQETNSRSASVRAGEPLREDDSDWD